MWDVAIDHGVRVRLGWLATLLCARRTIIVPPEGIAQIEVALRNDLEPLLDNRVLGLGTSVGRRLQGRTRVGRFLGRSVVGEQFWAVPSGDPSTQRLLVVHCEPPRPYARLVLGVDDPDRAADRLRPPTEA